MRSIDADALKDYFQSLAYDGWNHGITTSWADAYRECADIVENTPTITPERKRGRWLEKKVVHAINDGCIAEWQSCKCSVCGRYDTRPYMYYFDEPNFCSWCGASMQEGES